MICQTVSQLTHSGSLYFCSGYFNPTLPLCAAIRDSQCSVNLLSADREANGFNKAPWPKSGITPAYQMFADFMLKSIDDKVVSLSEWNRDKARLEVLCATAHGPILRANSDDIAHLLSHSCTNRL